MEILKSKKFIKLGVGIDGDMKKLSNEFKLPIYSGSYFDLRFLAYYSNDTVKYGGLASLVRQVLNRKLGMESENFQLK